MSLEEFSVTQCSDEEFDQALKSFSLPEVDTAVQIFEKQIDVEQRIQAGLQNLIKLYKAQPGMATKDAPVNKFMASTKQLLASQGRLAVLRSRSLRCVTRRIELGGQEAEDYEKVIDGDETSKPSCDEDTASTVMRKGLNRYYQPGSLRQRPESEDSLDGRRRKQKEQPAMKLIKPIVVSVQIPDVRKQTVELETPSFNHHQKQKPLATSVRAVGRSLGSAELTVHIKPHRHLRLHAREIPHTFSYIETESIVVQRREQPLASRDHGSVVTPNKRQSTPVSPQRVTAIVPSKFSLLASAKKEARQSQPTTRRRASTLPAKLLRKPTADRSRKIRKFSPDPIPSHQTTYHIPSPFKLGPAVQVCLDVNRSENGILEEEGDASSTVIIAPPRPPPPQEDIPLPWQEQKEMQPQVPDSESTSQIPEHPPDTLMNGEVCVRVGERSDSKPKEHHPTKIVIHGEKQEDPKRDVEVEVPVVIVSDDEKEEESPVEELAEYDSESKSDEEAERPREDYKVRINIDSVVPVMVHEPIPPPVPIAVVHATWDSVDFNEELEPQPTETEKQEETYVQSTEPQLESHMLPTETEKQVASDVDETEVPNRALDQLVPPSVLTEAAVQPEPVAQLELPDLDPVHSPVELSWSPPRWPEIQSPEPSEDLIITPYEEPMIRKICNEEESSLPEIHNEPTSPADVDIDVITEIDWRLEPSIEEHKRAKPVPVSVTLLRIIVSDVQQHPNYADYKIEFKSCLPCFPWGESVVRRRLQEFVWLKRKLKSPGVYVPPINGSLDNLEELQDVLQHFLRLVCSDPMHQYEESLHLFLKSAFPIPDAILISRTEIEEMLEEAEVELEDDHSSVASNDGPPEPFMNATKWNNFPQFDSIELQLTALENLRPLEDGGESGVAGLGKFTTIASGRLSERDDLIVSDGDPGIRKNFLEEMAVAPPPTVQAWLEDLQMEQYIPRFLDYGYDEIWVCAHLDDEDLVQLGILEKEDREKLLANANLWKYRLAPEDIKTPKGKECSFSFDLPLSQQTDFGTDATDHFVPDTVVAGSPSHSPTVSLTASLPLDSLDVFDSPSTEFPIMRSASASAAMGGLGPGPGSYDTLTRHYLKITTEKQGIDNEYGIRGLRVRHRGNMAIYGTLPRAKQVTADDSKLDRLDEKRHDFVSIKSWDPSNLLSELYKDTREAPKAVTEPLKYVSENKSKANIKMAGYLEKLPLNQKKPSFLHGWKKRYFKATNGNLFYFEDSKSEKAIGFIKLAGSKISAAGEKQIQITEKKDKFLLLRTQTTREAADWLRVLENECVVNVSDQLQFLNLRTVVIDLGTSSIRAGIAYDDAYPQLYLPNVIAVDRRESATRKFGIEALRPDIRDLCDVYYPFKGSLGVDKTSRADAQDLICIFEEAFRQLQIDPREFKVVISHSQFTTPRMKELIMNVLFEHLGVQAVYMQDQSVFSMYSYHETTGIMVDIGDRVDIVPVVQGYVVESGVTRLPYGGKALTDHLMRLLTESGYRFFSEVESYITRYVKEQSCKVALNYETTISAVEANPQRYTAVVDVSHLGLPDKSQVVSLNSGRFRSTEGLFQPRVLGKDNPGIHELVQKAVQACAMDTRKELYRNIFLSGGTTKLPGFAERLEKELCALVPSSVLIQVHSGPDRQHAAYIGASVAASLSNFDEMCVWQEDWLRNGPESMHKWS